MLEVRDLHVRYGPLEVLSGVTMHVRKGEFVTLIGPNGAGKTTLLLTLSGILKPSAGMIHLDGKRIDAERPHRIVQLGLGHVAQGRELFPDMTVRENLEMGAHRIRNRDRLGANLESVFDFFPILRERAAQRAATLSGGEQQMLAIARVLMAEPRLLVLDEPSIGLAPVVVDLLADILVRLHQEGLTILLVEQNAYLALDLAQRAFILESGQISHEGAAGELKESELVRRAYLGI